MYQLLTCPVCRAAGSGPLGLCARCAGSLLEPTIGAFELSLGPYSGPLERAVRAYKFGGVRRLGRLFGLELAGVMETAGWQADVICAVPLHPLRYMQRGYNQSALVARVAARQAGLPTAPSCGASAPPDSRRGSGGRRGRATSPGRFGQRP